MVKTLLLSLLSISPYFATENNFVAKDPIVGHIEMTLIETDPIISVNGSNIRVQNGAGEALEVYNITGLRVFSKKIEKADVTISLKLPKGCYILKVGKTVRKFSIA